MAFLHYIEKFGIEQKNELGVCAAERKELGLIGNREGLEMRTARFCLYDERRPVRTPVVGCVSGLPGSGFPDYAHSIIPFIRRKFTARVTRFHSPVTLFKPRRLNCRKPSTDLIHPNGGSPTCFRAR